MNCEDSFDCWSFCGLNSGLEGTDWEKMGEADLEGYVEPLVADDIVDPLPIDPFGMDISSKIAITRWFQDLGEESDSSFWVDEAEKEFADHGGQFAGLNWGWNGSKFEPEVRNTKIDGFSIPCDGFDRCGVDNGLFNVEGFMSFGLLGNWVVSKGPQKSRDCGETCFDGEGGAPHDALFFALGYLGVQDLLSVEMVCKSLRDAVRSDSLLWRSIHIDQPLSIKITDDALLKLANRAQGTLQCLNLVDGVRITDGGLKRVLETSPRLTKLSVPGCIRLSAEGILNNLRAFNSIALPGIKQLRLAGICRITDKQFKEFRFLLNADNCLQMSARKPLIYTGRKLCVSSDDDRAIDIEVCPKCQELSLVYDCPAESCRGKHQSAQLCRACIRCISRCIECGRCLKDCDYEETFFLDLLCFACPLTPDGPGEKGASNCTVFHRETRYQFCFYS